MTPSHVEWSVGAIQLPMPDAPAMFVTVRAQWEAEGGYIMGVDFSVPVPSTLSTLEEIRREALARARAAVQWLAQATP